MYINILEPVIEEINLWVIYPKRFTMFRLENLQNLNLFYNIIEISLSSNIK